LRYTHDHVLIIYHHNGTKTVNTSPKHTLFIADLHLDESHQKTTAIFLEFLRTQALHADALYILGDLFEVWIGDDEISGFNENIKHSLKQLTAIGVPVYIMVGNRDFLIGQRFAKATGCQLLPDPFILDLYGQLILLTHGDALCTLDKWHMRFRKLTQNRFLRWFFLQLPLSMRRAIAKKLRSNSQRTTQTLPDYIMDVAPEEVLQQLRRYDVSYLIHGHTHRPAIHQHYHENLTVAERIVLGAWEQQGSALKWLADGAKELMTF
jgi:UDP-2,3-diacylglucosamine hydrolase